MVKILGARGSVACSGAGYLRYGGRTTCVLVRLCGQCIVLDAGTGLMTLADALAPEETVLSLLLTHPHADHLVGFPLCRTLYDSRITADVYAAERDGLDTKAQLERFMSPPLWPVTPDVMGAKLSFHPLRETLALGPVTVDTLEGAHPGGVTLLRLCGGGKSVVFLSDCTLTEALFPVLTEFAAGCDLLLCDGQYSDAEWAVRSGFGHSRWTDAARLAAACGAKALRVIHHDPNHTDDILDAAADSVREIFPGGALARDGEEVLLP